MRPAASSPLLGHWPLLGLAVLLIVLITASAALWAGTTPAGAQDGYQPDPDLIEDVWEYAKEMTHGPDHVLRWMRVLKTLGAIEDMSAAKAQEYANQYSAERWDPVVAELEQLEAAPGDYQPNREVVEDVEGYAGETGHGFDHVLRWMRVLKTLGAIEDMSAAKAQEYADQYSAERWDPVVAELEKKEASTSEPDPSPTPEPTPQPPPAPAGLTATGGDTTIDLSWTDPSDGAITGYQVRMSADGGTTWDPDWSDISGSGSATTSHTLTGLTNDTDYTIELRALRGETAGEAASATATPRPEPPPTPVGLTATGGDTAIDLSWTDPSDTAITKYQFRVSADGGTTWNPDWSDISSSGSATTSHTLTGLSNDTDYTIELRAVRGATSAGPAARATATPESTASSQDGYEPDPELIANVWTYARETEHGFVHQLRWLRVLQTLGAIEGMTAAQAQENADRHLAERWDPVVVELEKLENAPGDYEPDQEVVEDVEGYAKETGHGFGHQLRWMRVLHTLGAIKDMSAAEAQGYADQGWERWDPVVEELEKLEAATPPNRAPVFNGVAQRLDNALPGFLVSLPMRQSDFSDPDGDLLTFTLSASRDDVYALGDEVPGGFVHNERLGRVFFLAKTTCALASLPPPTDDAYYTVITMTAADPDGATAQTTATFRTDPATFACPALSSATADGATLTLVFDEELAPSFAVPAAGEFTVRADEVAVSVTGIGEVSEGDETIVLTLATPVYAGQTVTVSYAPDAYPVAAVFSDRPVEPRLPRPAGTSQNFAVSATAGSLDLSAVWDEVEGATSYKLRWRQAGGEFEAANAITVTDTSATITVSGYGQWEVQLQACNDAGCGSDALQTVDIAQVALSELALQAAPRNLTATLAENTGFTFNLTAEFSIDATGFQTSVNRVGPNRPTEPSSIGSQLLPTPSEEDASDGWFSHSWQVSNIDEADCGKELGFHVTAYGPGGLSEAVSASAPAIECPISGQPSGFKAWGDAADSTAINLVWNDGSSSKWRLTYQATDSDESNSIEINYVSPSAGDVPAGSYNNHTPYQLSGLECGKTYAFTVEGNSRTHPASTSANTAACEGEGPGGLSAPPSPGAFRVETSYGTSASMYFSWSSSSGIDKYRVEYRAVGEDDWAKFEDFNPPTGLYAVGGRLDGHLACEAFYRFRIRARGDGTTFSAEWSSPTTSLQEIYSLDCPPPAADAPAAPTGFSSVGGYLSVTLSWDDPQDDSITKYQYLLDDPAEITVGAWKDIPNSGAGTTTYTISGMPRERFYQGYLRAVNEHGPGDSAFYTWIRPDPLALPPEDVASGAPDAPTGFSYRLGLGEDGPTISAMLSWDDPQDDSITKYQYRLEDGTTEGVWTDIPNSGASTTFYVITKSLIDPWWNSLASYLRAVNEHGPGAPAGYRWIDYFTPQPPRIAPQPPRMPKNLAVSGEAGELSLIATWSPVKYASSYNLRWRQGSDAGFQRANEVTVTDADAAFSVAGLGNWIVQVEACNEVGCGPTASLPIVVSADAAPNIPAITPVCDRTPQVRDLLAKYVRKECADITAADLAKVEKIRTWDLKGLTSLKSGDFDGLYNVTEISLFEHALTTLPEDIFNHLYSLQELDLGIRSGPFGGGGGITALPENVFAGLYSLQELDLSGNARLLTLPGDVFDGLSSLHTLNLEYCSLTALPEDVFDGMSSLQTLDLSDNDLTALPEDVFDGLSSLQTLDIHSNELAALPDEVFDGLSSLQTLNSRSNNLTTLPEDVFDGLSNLEELDVGSNYELTALPEDVFDGLSNLKTLDLAANTSLTELPEDVFDGLSNLQSLDLSTNSDLTALPEDVFGGLSNLQTLNLEHSRLTALPEDVFDGLSNLEELDLSSLRLKALPEDVFDGLSNLRVLNLDGNGNYLQLQPGGELTPVEGMSELPEDVFEGLSNLRELYLDFNSLTELPEDVFDGLSSLQILNLHRNDLVALPEDVFDGLTDLQELDLRSNYLSELPDDVFNGLSSLQNLDLSANPGAPFDLTDLGIRNGVEVRQ